ncbi:MAG: isoprenylcysteine carboxylmethyltransferase family protein [Anaerolineales bacterium]|nr:isoprenylcysteine carboxylmethyltransferase family protein [Anaerolineales bacterium]
MSFLVKTILFVLATGFLLWVSLPSLRDIQHHGFYRFFSWETILILLLMNVDHWFVNPFSPGQIISWLFLILSIMLILQGVRMFRRKGNINQDREDPVLVGIEKTTELVTTGVYHYIRHPFYSSLLFLGWGILLKNVNWIGILLALVNTILLVLTARKEEVINIQYFGEKYQDYKRQTKMFIPFIF